MKFSVSQEVRKVLELLDSSPRVRWFLWAVLLAGFVVGVLVFSPATLYALAALLKVIR